MPMSTSNAIPKTRMIKGFKVIVVRKPLIGSVMAGGGGGGSGNAGTGGPASFSNPSALYGVSREFVGFTNDYEEAMERKDFVISWKSLEGDEAFHRIFTSLNGVHSVEFEPVYYEL